MSVGKRLVAILIAAACAAPALAAAPDGATLDALGWSADGSTLAGILRADGETSLTAWSAASGEVRWSLPLDGATAHDGTRLPRPESFGLSRDGGLALLSGGGELYLWRPADHQVRRLTRTAGAERDALLAPDGSAVAFVRDGDVRVLDLAQDQETRLTPDALPQASSSPPPALAWAPDSSALLDLRESSAPSPALSPRVRVGVSEAPWQSERPLETGDEGTPVHATWRFDGGAIAVERESADGRRIDLLLCHPDRLYCRDLASRVHAPGVEIGDSFRFLASGFLWGSESGATRGLDLYDTLGRPRARLLPAGWDLVSVLAVDAPAGRVTVLALRAEGPDRGRRGVLSLSWERAASDLLAEGDDEALPAPTGGVWVHGWRDADGAPHRALLGRGGEKIADLPPSGERADAISSEELP